VVIQQAARKTTETPSPELPLAVKEMGGEPDHVLWRSNLGADHERQYKRYGLPGERPGTEPLAVVRPLHGGHRH
jgi:hypothetical protein